MLSKPSFEEEQNKKYICRLSPTYSSVEDPLYDYEYETNITAHYTFYTTFAFTQGQHVSISTTEINNLKHVLYLFSSSNPENYSWAIRSNTSNHSASLDITIPQTGIYYVLVRSNGNGMSGYCNLNVNNNHFPNIPINCTRVKCNIDTLTTYNIFTVKTQGNPCVWIESENSILSYGKICCYNDSYHGLGDFDWGTNARVKKKFDQPAQSVLVSHFGAYSPVSQLDLYMKCKNNPEWEWGFPNLRQDDAIKSSDSTAIYTCYSWSGGITSYRERPFDINSDFYDTINCDTLTCFDNFYASRGLTRVGANESNAIVALWAIVDENGHREYRHASVRAGDGRLHGYDWESKMGSESRVFHPKGGMAGPYYGEIVEYYTHIPNSIRNSSLSIEEEIADGVSRIEYVRFTDEENNIIADSINNIDRSIKEEFNVLYAKWKHVNIPFLVDSSDLYKCKEYSCLLEFCKNHPESIYLLYKYLGNEDWAALDLIEAFHMNQKTTIEFYKNRSIECAQRLSQKTYRSPISNCISYVKTLLRSDDKCILNAKKHSNATEIEGISYSNSDIFNVHSNSDDMNVSFNLNENSTVTLETLDLSGRTVSVIFRNRNLNAGEYSYTINRPNGNIILIRLIVDNRVNVKKCYLN